MDTLNWERGNDFPFRNTAPIIMEICGISRKQIFLHKKEHAPAGNLKLN